MFPPTRFRICALASSRYVKRGLPRNVGERIAGNIGRVTAAQVTDITAVHPAKADPPTEVIPEGRYIVSNPLQPFITKLRILVIASGKLMEVSDTQFSNARSMMSVTPSGISTDCSAEHPERAA